jgi:hypothetical protein
MSGELNMYSELIRNDVYDQEFDKYQQWCRDGKDTKKTSYHEWLKEFKWPNLYAVTGAQGWTEDDWKSGFSACKAWFVEEPGDDEKIKTWLALEGYTNIESVLA